MLVRKQIQMLLLCVTYWLYRDLSVLVKQGESDVKIIIYYVFQIGLGSPHVFMPKIKGLRESGMKNSSVSIFEICLCSDGSMFAADINQGCYDSARESGYCPSTQYKYIVQIIYSYCLHFCNVCICTILFMQYFTCILTYLYSFSSFNPIALILPFSIVVHNS